MATFRSIETAKANGSLPYPLVRMSRDGASLSGYGDWYKQGEVGYIETFNEKYAKEKGGDIAVRLDWGKRTLDQRFIICKLSDVEVIQS